MLASVLFPTLGRTCADLAAFAFQRRTRPNRTALAPLLNAPPFHFQGAGVVQRGRKLQRLTFRYKHGLQQACICTSMTNTRLRLRMAHPLVNAASRNRQIQLQLAPSHWCAALALLFVAVSSSSSFSQGTLEQRLACTPDVMRLCSAFIPDADQITICLKEKRSELSDACRTVFEAATNQPPNASDSPGVGNRPIK
jgi:hypothetical protein